MLCIGALAHNIASLRAGFKEALKDLSSSTASARSYYKIIYDVVIVGLSKSQIRIENKDHEIWSILLTISSSMSIFAKG